MAAAVVDEGDRHRHHQQLAFLHHEVIDQQARQIAEAQPHQQAGADLLQQVSQAGHHQAG